MQSEELKKSNASDASDANNSSDTDNTNDPKDTTIQAESNTKGPKTAKNTKGSKTAKPTKTTASTNIVTADSVQSEEVPTVPLTSLQTISTLQPEVSVHSIASTRGVSIPEPLVVQPSEYRRSLGEWIQVLWDGIRPVYFPLSLAPVFVGSTLAWTQTISPKTPFGHFHVTHFMGTLLAVLLIQIGANLVNDYYDYLHGTDTSNPFGPGGLIQQGLIKPANVLITGLVVLGLGAVIGLVIAAGSGPLVYLFGLIGLLCAYFYSATSRSLSALSLGELAGLGIFGPLITLGAYMIQVGHTDRLALIYGLVFGLLAAAVIHINNMRDIESDAHAGKHTLASRLGLRLSRVLFIGLVVAAYSIVIALGVPKGAPHLVLLTLWTLPTLLVVLSGAIRSDASAGLHMVMHQTLRLETYFAFFLIAALIIIALFPIFPHLPTHLLPS